LRFSRLFSNTKPSLKEQIWWTSRTFKKKGTTTTKLSTEQEELAAISNLKMSTEGKENREKEEVVVEEEPNNQKIFKTGWDFKFGDLHKKDCLTDEYVCFLNNLCRKFLKRLADKICGLKK